MEVAPSSPFAPHADILDRIRAELNFRGTPIEPFEPSPPEQGELVPEVAATEKPSRIESSHADLTEVQPKVVTETLGPMVREVVIAGALGGQVGNKNKQINEFRYEVKSVTVSVNRIFDGHPERTKAFERLAANPDSRGANKAFRKLLSDGPTYLGGEIKTARANRPETVRVAVSPDGDGPIALDANHIKGLQAGDRNRQHNDYKCIIKGAELNAEAILRRNPRLATDLALAVRYPSNDAIKRSFTHKLSDACRPNGWQDADVITRHIDADRITVPGVAVQVGVGNVRVDKYRLDPEKKMTPVGWEGLPESIAANLERAQRLAQAHADRIAESRTVGSGAPAPSPPPPNLLPTILGRTAAVALNQVAPGRQHLAERLAEDAKRALGRVEKSGRDDGRSRLIGRGDGYRALRPWTPQAADVPQEARAEASGQAPGSSAFSGRRAAEQAVVDHPYLEFVSSADRMDPVSGPGEGIGASGPGGPPTRLAAPASAGSPAEPAGRRGKAVFATAALVCGPATDVAAAMNMDGPEDEASLSDADLLLRDAGALLRYVRRRMFDEKRNGRFELVINAWRAVEALQVVLFLDPYAGRGLWVDVDPVSQTPAAALPVKLDWSAGRPGPFRFFGP
jgi:hypothetical protein